MDCKITLEAYLLQQNVCKASKRIEIDTDNHEITKRKRTECFASTIGTNDYEKAKSRRERSVEKM